MQKLSGCADEAAHDKLVVLTSPRINIRISFLPHISPVKSLDILAPITAFSPNSSVKYGLGGRHGGSEVWERRCYYFRDSGMDTQGRAIGYSRRSEGSSRLIMLCCVQADGHGEFAAEEK